MGAETPAYAGQNWKEYIKTSVDLKTESYRKKGERYRWRYLIMACTSAVFARRDARNLSRGILRASIAGGKCPRWGSWAGMPRSELLPEDLKELTCRNAIELTHVGWNSDVEV